jgi:hypothetical protein
MAIDHAKETHRRVERFLERLSGMPTIAAIGFQAIDAEASRRRFDGVAQDRRWRFCDLRACDAETALTRLKTDLEAPLLIVAVGASEIPSSLLRLAQATADGHHEVDLGTLDPVSRPNAQTVIVLVEGATEVLALPPALQRIPYWEIGNDA